ncbi:MAG: sigma factor-like helix-turn-helix DNA-binding protein [Parcubacteria group bacterium]
MNLSGLDMQNFIKKLLEDADLDARSSNILNKRFGLESKKTFTLQALGAKYGITRERVRQLESQAVNELKKSIGNFEEVAALKEFAERHLFATGGLRKDDMFMEELHSIAKSAEERDVFGNKARFVFRVTEFPYFSEENNVFHSYWYVNDEAKKKMETIHEEITRNLTAVEQFDELLRSISIPKNVQESVILGFLEVSKRLGVGPYGDIGLSEWEEINPKTVRAKAFVLLKREGKPMHFTEIARMIKSHAPTVHNELIKDPRFILMGRGTYGLKLK